MKKIKKYYILKKNSFKKDNNRISFMSRNTIFLTAFNDKFSEFVDTIVNFFPNDSDILATRTLFSLMRKNNPKLLVKAWQNYVQSKYSNEIETGDILFFISKDYHSDLSENPDSDYVIEVINRLRKPIHELTEENINTVAKYLQILNKLCNAYFLRFKEKNVLCT
jgi:hypothetical protein